MHPTVEHENVVSSPAWIRQIFHVISLNYFLYLMCNCEISCWCRVSANALKAVYNLPRRSWDNEILNVAEKIYYQKDRLYDSTARSVAIDILVDAGPNYESLSHLMRSLQSNTSHETRKYLLQRLQQVAST